MKKTNGVRSRIIAGCMAVVMALSLWSALVGGVGTAHAAAQSVKINATNFPDPIFRSVISGPEYDRDGNGTLDATEIGLTLNIYCEGMGIKSIKGVEYFVDLQGLWCKDNQISSIDVRKLKDLRGLWCSNNPITSLDISQNTKLVWVYCFDCKLTELDVSHNPQMAYIECNTNPITELDVSHNPELEHLMCGTCELTTLDVSNNPKLAHLDAFQNHFKTLDVTHNPEMKRLDIWNNPGLGSIDVSKCPGLQYYNCASNDVKTLDVSKNPELQKLICSYNEIKTLNLSNNPKLVCLNCEDNQLSKLDLTHNPQLRYLQAAINPFTSLNIGNNPFLVKTYKDGKFQQEWFGRSWTINYGGDDSTGGDNKFYIWANDGVTISTKATGTVALGEEKYSELDPGVTEADLVTREHVVQVLYELAGKPSVSGLTTRFTDVQSGTDYTNALLWGEKNAICVGYPYTAADTFGVGKWLTRQDLMLMLMRYSEYKHYKREIDFGRSDEYLDYFDINYDHWEAVCWCATWIIMEGKGEDGAPKSEQRIDPYGRVSRTEVKNAFLRLFEVNKVTVTSSINAILEKINYGITSQPENKSVQVGNVAEFKVKANGQGILKYQWQAKGPGSSTWSNSTQSGSTTSKLSVATNVNHNGYQYRCIVTDGTGKKYYSNAAKLTITPKITKQPANTGAVVGEKTVFTIAANGKEPLKYQWQCKAPNATEWSASTQSGATTATLSVSTKEFHDGYQYRCVVTDGNGKKSYSNVATMTLLRITENPKTVIVQAGKTATFSVAATGMGTLKYQWQKKESGSSVWTNLTQGGATTAKLSVPTTVDSSGAFRCVITDGSGKKVYTGAVSLLVSPKITIQPADVRVKDGATAVFTVAAEGKGTLVYQWQCKAPNATEWTNSTQSGAKTARLSVSTTLNHNGYQYRCAVYGSNGAKSYSEVATLAISTVPLTITKQPNSIRVPDGAQAAFYVTVTGTVPVTYQWQYLKPGTTTWSNSTQSGAKTRKISINVQKSHNGYKYRCVVTDGNGKKVISDVATLGVSTIPFKITSQPTARTVTAGTTATFSVAATGTAELTYQWQYKAPGSTTWANSTQSGAKTGKLSIATTKNHNGYQYRCIVTNGYGKQLTSNEVKLTVK